MNFYEISQELKQKVLDARKSEYEKAKTELDKASDKLNKLQNLTRDSIDIVLLDYHLNTYKVNKEDYKKYLSTMEEPSTEEGPSKVERYKANIKINLNDVMDSYETLIWDGLLFWNMEYPFDKLKEHNFKLSFYSEDNETTLATMILLNDKLEYSTEEELKEFENGSTLLLGYIWCNVEVKEEDKKLFTSFLKKTRKCILDIKENYINIKKINEELEKFLDENKGERIYNKALNGSYINYKEFNEMQTYLKENGSKEDILKLANYYNEIYNNGFDKTGDHAAEFKSYEFALRKLANEK